MTLHSCRTQSYWGVGELGLEALGRGAGAQGVGCWWSGAGSGEEALDVGDDGVILGWDEALGSEESRVVPGWDTASCWLLGSQLSDMMFPCKVRLSLLVPWCLAQGVLISLLLMGWYVLYSSLVLVCLGCFEGSWSLREERWPKIWLTITVGVVATGKAKGSGQEVWLDRGQSMHVDSWGDTGACSWVVRLRRCHLGSWGSICEGCNMGIQCSWGICLGSFRFP